VRRAVFLVKNGIGYGHLRRAMLLAQALARSGRLAPVIVSQAHTLDLLATSGVPVVNFPLLHRVASAVLEDAYLEILDALLVRLDPAVVIEDTYPDARLAALPALQGRPRLLVMRRMDGASLDQVRSTGRLAAYEKILVAQTAEEFAREGHSPATCTAVESSGRFSFCGPLYQAPDPHAVERVRARYALDGAPLVVVNGGAGGDVYTDGWGDRFFAAAATAAARFADSGHPARFVLVTGPYYTGRELASAPNTAVVRFEPELPALLASADAVILRGGANALAEALSGPARLILAPGATFMEGTEAYAARTVAEYGGMVIGLDADEMTSAVEHALTQPPRTRRLSPPGPAIDAVVDTIEDLAAHRPAIAPYQLLLVIAGASDAVAATAESLMPAVGLLDPDPAMRIGGASLVSHGGKRSCALVATAPPGLAPAAMSEAGARLLLVSSDSAARGLERWQSLAPAPRHLLTVRISTVRAAPGRPELAAYQVAAACADSAAAIKLDLSGLADNEAEADLRTLAAWMKGQPLQLVDAARFLHIHSRQLLDAA
jgi:predicted glycosyltransferase